MKLKDKVHSFFRNLDHLLSDPFLSSRRYDITIEKADESEEEITFVIYGLSDSEHDRIINLISAGVDKEGSRFGGLVW